MLSQVTASPAARFFRHALIGLALVAATALPVGAEAQAQSQNSNRAAPQTNRYGDPIPAASEPGKFDFYVLALSWSPSFCEASRERNASRRPDPQCSGRPYAFVVHGLWPQHERGLSPANCQVPAPRVPPPMHM